MKKYFLILSLFIPLGCVAEESLHTSIHNHHYSIAGLSPDLRNLLSEEMRELQKGMVEIHPLYISGRWNEIVPIAKKIENSYVLKQNLSISQMNELHSKLPKDFITLDQNFHYLAGMLGHAAEMKKPELIGFYFSKMNDSCLACHTKYATQKFPDLATKAKPHSH